MEDISEDLTRRECIRHGARPMTKEERFDALSGLAKSAKAFSKKTLRRDTQDYLYSDSDAFTNFFRNILARCCKRFQPEPEKPDSECEEVDPCFVRYRPEDLNSLCRSTKFTKREIQMMYRGFKQGCPTGIVNREQFKEIYQQFFPQGDSAQYAMCVFNTFDRDGNGQISFDEFVLGLSVISRGTPEEKLKWIFDLYDADQDGELSRTDIEKVVGSVYDMMGRATVPPISPEVVRQHVDYFLEKMDLNNDGFISLEDFLEACSKDTTLGDSIALFDTIFS